MDDQELDYDEVDFDEVKTIEDSLENTSNTSFFKANVEDAKIERQETIATEKAFGIDPKIGHHLRITAKEAAALRKELEVDPRDYELRAAFVHGVDGMNQFQIQKVFSAFGARDVTKLDESTAIVQFVLRQDVAAMMLNMTKLLKRVRLRKKADEDGEVMSDDEAEVEDGQIMREKGDDVEVVDGVLESNEKGIVDDGSLDHVLIDVNHRKIPDGKWRVVTQHVASEKFLIVRFPTINEYKNVLKKKEDDVTSRVDKRKSTDEDFWTHEKKHKGGLNMFDKEGNELDWDYEHDTRFYEEKEKTEEKKIDNTFELPKGIKVRGRGAVKCGFLFGNKSKSLASDDQNETKKAAKPENVIYEKDDVLSRVTPSSTLEGRITYR